MTYIHISKFNNRNEKKLKQRFPSNQEKIQAFARASKPSIMAVGIGGAGCNIISWIKERGVAGGKLVSMNTDANHLTISKADSMILIGEKACQGIGCGGYPKLGEKAVNESMDEISEEISEANILFLLAGLGGGTGTGGIMALAENLREQVSGNKSPHLIIGVVTLPFEIETSRMNIAKKAIQRLKAACDTVVVIDNNRLIKLAGNLPMREALGVANTTVGKFVKGITETITCASLINLDYADMRSIMVGAGIASIGIGEAKGEGRVEQAAERALNGRLLDIEDVTKARGMLIHISGGEDMTLAEVHHAGELIKRSIPPKAKVIWGARVTKELHGTATVMAVLTGVESAFLQKQQKHFGRITLPF